MTSYIEYSEKGNLHSYEKAPQTVGTYHAVISALVERAGQILSVESPSLLDIGSGNGIYAKAFQKKVFM
ncbi:hypothetical protein KBD69_00185 [Candidatus Woesebacteria bacterium]|nr:hypothetical protein [Candidatus Woesebacteria bacterium]